MFNRDKLSSVFFFLTGLGFAIYSLTYKLGSFNNMGPGLFPLVISFILMGLGVGIFIRSFRSDINVELSFRLPALIIFHVICSALLFKMLGSIISSIYLIISTAYLHNNFKFQDTIKLIALALIFLVVIKLFLFPGLPL